MDRKVKKKGKKLQNQRSQTQKMITGLIMAAVIKATNV